jgi:hypothetical protein
MWTKIFWQKTLERAVKTVAQTLAAALVVGGTDLLSVGWKQALVTAGVAGLASLATSIASSGVADSSSPSLVKES